MGSQVRFRQVRNEWKGREGRSRQAGYDGQIRTGIYDRHNIQRERHGTAIKDIRHGPWGCVGRRESAVRACVGSVHTECSGKMGTEPTWEGGAVGSAVRTSLQKMTCQADLEQRERAM